MIWLFHRPAIPPGDHHGVTQMKPIDPRILAAIRRAELALYRNGLAR